MGGEQELTWYRRRHNKHRERVEYGGSSQQRRPEGDCKDLLVLPVNSTMLIRIHLFFL
jgi:hypothetical protein